MTRIRSKTGKATNAGNIRMGISLPIEIIAAIDEWALSTGHVLPNGSVNRSGALRTLASMWFANDDMLKAAVKAMNIGLVGSVGEVARLAYIEAHEKTIAAIDNL